MLTRCFWLIAVVALLAAAYAPSFAAEVESANVEPAESITAVPAMEAVEAETIERAVPEEWEAEREMVDAIRAEAARRIASIEDRLKAPDLSGDERLALQREIGDVKVTSEIRIQEIRLAVAEERGMTRHAEEIRKALEHLKKLDAPERGVAVDRSSGTAPGVVPQAVPAGTVSE